MRADAKSPARESRAQRWPGRPGAFGADAPARTLRAFVALGANLGDRAAHLNRALRALAQTPGLRLLRASRIYETAPAGGPPQGDYLNAVAELQSALPPRALLARLQQIERAAGRRRSSRRNAPRSLDLDLLFYGAAPRRYPDLILPHPRLHLRGFVLAPLAELKPALHLQRGGRAAGGVRLWRGGILSTRRATSARPLG